MKIVIINYGAGNIQSIKFAIQRLGYEAVLTHDEKEIKEADKVIFPGVGEASSAMKMGYLDPTIRTTGFRHLPGDAIDVPLFRRGEYQRVGYF